jgi:hypothetical protein
MRFLGSRPFGSKRTDSSFIFGRMPTPGVGTGCFSPIFSLRLKDFRITPWRKKKQLLTSALVPWTDFFVHIVPEKGIEFHLEINDCLENSSSGFATANNRMLFVVCIWQFPAACPGKTGPQTLVRCAVHLHR